jgi:hypothetical protein
VLDANPLEDIHNTTKIAAVVFDGRYYPREALAQMLAAAEKLASRKSFVEPLLAILTAKDAAAAIAEYRRLKASEPAFWNFEESELKTLGYRLLEIKRLPDAAARHPGAQRRVLPNLELDPQNLNAVAKLKELEKP